MPPSSSSAHIVALQVRPRATMVSYAEVAGKRFVRVTSGAMRSYFEVGAEPDGSLADVTDRQLRRDIDEAASAPVIV